MNYLNVSVLAAITSLALLVCGGTASATTLFTDEDLTVPYPKGTTMSLTLAGGSSMELTDGGITIATCTKTTRHETIENETGTGVIRKLDSFTWGGCSQTTHTIATGSSEIKWTSGSNGTVIDKGTQMTVGIFGVSCTYGTGEGTHIGTLQGGAPATLKVETTITKTAGGFLCPSKIGWDAMFFNVTAPHALYVGP